LAFGNNISVGPCHVWSAEPKKNTNEPKLLSINVFVEEKKGFYLVSSRS